MLYCTVTSNGRTTIPGEIRQALGIREGDKLEYAIEGDRLIIRRHPGLRALKGALASDKGKGLSWARIRKSAGMHTTARGK